MPLPITQLPFLSAFNNYFDFIEVTTPLPRPLTRPLSDIRALAINE
jgi:hypothetical protein